MEKGVVDRVYNRLQTSDHSRTVVGPFDIELSKEPGQVRLITPIFLGGNYIPGSVRRCLAEGQLMAGDAHTSIRAHIDEENFRVLLTYQAIWDGDRSALLALLDDFVGLADEWRRLLDDYGEQDLVYVPAS